MKYNDALLRPRYEETDQMGVIYHANYYRYFECGRSEFFRSLGYTYKEIEADGIIQPVIDSYCKYIKPAYYDEEIIVRTTISQLKGIRLVFEYVVLKKETNEILVTGKTTHTFVDLDFKPVRFKNLPEKLKNILSEFLTN